MSKCAACSGARRWKRRNIRQVPSGRVEAKAYAHAANKPQPPLANPSPGQPRGARGFVEEKAPSDQLHVLGCSRLQLQREPGGDEDHGLGGGADFPVRPSLPVAKLAAELVIWHNAHTHFVGYEDDRAGKAANGVGESVKRGTRVAAAQDEIAEPERQTIDNHHPAWLRV